MLEIKSPILVKFDRQRKGYFFYKCIYLLKQKGYIQLWKRIY